MQNYGFDIDKISETCARYKVEKLYLFGSHAKGTFNPNSDFDFLVFFKPIELLDYADNFFELNYALEKIVGTKVDLVSGKSLKNPYFIKEVDATKLLIYG
ncbi:MAG: nucleotidyltransferase domain-containing protein [Bacteroidota bacterium]|nr:nucleotidyltransferase domain-containing protein [Bacteroidota bacterium]